MASQPPPSGSRRAWRRFLGAGVVLAFVLGGVGVLADDNRSFVWSPAATQPYFTSQISPARSRSRSDSFFFCWAVAIWLWIAVS